VTAAAPGGAIVTAVAPGVVLMTVVAPGGALVTAAASGGALHRPRGATAAPLLMVAGALLQGNAMAQVA
jgi:hypothetical protein